LQLTDLLTHSIDRLSSSHVSITPIRRHRLSDTEARLASDVQLLSQAQRRNDGQTTPAHIFRTPGQRSAFTRPPFTSISSPIAEASQESEYRAYGPIFSGNPASQPPTSTLTTPWWELSSSRSQSNPVLDLDWSSTGDEDRLGRKRMPCGDWEMPPQQSSHFRQSMQISPRTNPTRTLTPLPYSTYAMSPNYQNIYERPNANLLGPVSWPILDWNTFSDSNTNNFISQSLHQGKATTTSAEPSDNFSSEPLKHSSCLQGKSINVEPSPINSWPDVSYQTIIDKSTEHTDPPCPSTVLSNGSCKELQYITTQKPSSAPQVQFGMTVHSQLDSHTQDRSQPHPNATRAPPVTHERDQKNERLKFPHGNLQVTRPSDIARKPSLYKIPPWPTSSDENSQSLPIATNPCASRAATPISADKNGHQSTSKYKSLGPCATVPTPPSPEESLQKDGSVMPVKGGFQIPKARAGRKNSPNLCV
jgi:hypothetical protein